MLHPSTNRLLDALPDHERVSFLPKLKQTFLRPNEVLVEQGSTYEAVYFPINAVISLTTPLENGANIEGAAVGRDGMLGLGLLLGVPTAIVKAVVQVPGDALCAHRQEFEHNLHRSLSLQRLLHRYTYALLSQCLRSALCNGLHHVEARLARALLTLSDTIQSAELPLTHEALADKLGVSRPTVTMTATRFQSVGLMSYTRGRIVILDRSRLEALACECYRHIHDEYRRILD